MTNEEAIKAIELAKTECKLNCPLDYQVAFDMAIKALQKQEKYKWHNIKKHPKDLPTDPEELYMVWDDYFEAPKLWKGNVVRGTHFSDVIAWREIEKFN